ncbi:MAG TPA: aminopeptidase [Planctomycetaceae bacterium]|nr:aminopeptidase [Planctomycetaceae bacterium]
MPDPRISRLADVLVNHSCRIQSGEKILIEAFDLKDCEIVSRIVETVASLGAIPVVNLKDNQVLRSQYRAATKASMILQGELESHVMSQMDAYIGIRGAENSNEFVDVPTEKMDLFQAHWWTPVHLGIRVPKTRWVVLRYPTPSMAQAANMSTEAFEEYYFNVCTADYAQMAVDQKPLADLMERTDKVRIVAPGTDLTFSIKDIPVVPCAGECNIPDGEVFTAPIRESVNGTIAYNTGSRYQGTVFEGISFTFENGKIIHAECRNETDKLNHILDMDEGARYIGEWSLGCNNAVKRPMLDTLFDEKIGGSLHLTPGNAYDKADNGNRSQVHWDLVLIQTPEYGGGEIWFDDLLIRKDGEFLPDDLQPLNKGL